MASARLFDRVARVLARSAGNDPELMEALADLGTIERRLEQVEADRDAYIKKLSEREHV